MKEMMKKVMEAMEASGKEVFVFGGDKDAWDALLSYAKNENCGCDCSIADCEEKTLEQKLVEETTRTYLVTYDDNNETHQCECDSFGEAYELVANTYCDMDYFFEKYPFGKMLQAIELNGTIQIGADDSIEIVHHTLKPATEKANNRLYTIVIDSERDDELYTLEGAYERMKNYYCDYLEEMSEREFKEQFPIKDIVNGYEFEDNTYIDYYEPPKGYKYVD